MIRHVWPVVVLCPALVAGAISCNSGRRARQVSPEGRSIDNRKVRVEAYLFDAKLRRRGKPTSIRLDVYQTDSVVALYGRGYFNKGAFRGRLTDDSLQIYFPTVDEYLYDSVEKLFSSFKCESHLGDLNLLSYFMTTPDTVATGSGLNIELVDDNNDEREYTVSADECEWHLSLVYSLTNELWRLEEFSFDDNDEVSLKGKRRKYKTGVDVSADKFLIDIPAGAIPISL